MTLSLDGVRVLELARYQAGPRGGMIMMGKDFENPWGLKTPKGEVKMMSSQGW